MGIRIKDNANRFIQASEKAVDRALNRMAIEIERISKEQVPHDKGPLKASGKHVRYGVMQYRVFYNKVYALFQHEGGDGKRVVRNYSKPGKKKHYLIDPARLVIRKKFDYLKQEVQAIRL